MRKFLTKRNIIIAVVILAGLGVWWWRAGVAARKAAAAVKIVQVTRKDIESVLSVSGEIVSDKEATLTFPAAGKLSYVGVAEGDSVKKGQALLSLDPGDLETAVRDDYYAYLAADANAKEVEDSVKGHDSDETFAQKNARVAAQTARDEAYDVWLKAQRALHNSTLYAPFDGIVTNITANAVGDTVGVTDGATVVDPASLHFEAEVDETDIGGVEVGMPARLTLDAFSGQTIDATVQRIGYVTQISSTGATVFPVEMAVTDPIQSKFRIGMNGDADIILGTAKNVLTLPIEAVNDNVVNLPNGKTATIETGLAGVNDIQVTGGLNEGDKVVIK